MDAYEKKEEKLLEQSNRLREAQAKVDALYDQQMVELERISGLTSEEAKQELLDNVREEVKHDKARPCRRNGIGGGNQHCLDGCGFAVSVVGHDGVDDDIGFVHEPF